MPWVELEMGSDDVDTSATAHTPEVPSEDSEGEAELTERTEPTVRKSWSLQLL